ncbi:hypothetical protein KFK09_015111 [Dendrobium nobile]|uniref:Uncharacterized protein n=1 Tax=Dendrobium nobile TaxID=94219 RepID=A0A8T3B515_DENNO|nr:hypothetical protein KFK09_015111 [Dendrobium nobile]
MTMNPSHRITKEASLFSNSHHNVSCGCLGNSKPSRKSCHREHSNIQTKFCNIIFIIALSAFTQRRNNHNTLQIMFVVQNFESDIYLGFLILYHGENEATDRISK